MRVGAEIGLELGLELGSELGYGIVVGMGERTEFCIDGVCSEFGFGSFPEMSVGDCVPLHQV